MSHEINKNVNWIGKRFYVFYTFVILAGAFIVYFFFARPGIVTFYQGCTIVHVGHGLISFAMMHLFQGAPGELRDQGEYHDMSWWEQLEGGLPWTLHKKILMLVPLLLFLFVSHLTAYSGSHLLINASILALVMVPKLRAVHRHRTNPRNFLSLHGTCALHFLCFCVSIVVYAVALSCIVFIYLFQTCFYFFALRYNATSRQEIFPYYKKLFYMSSSTASALSKSLSVAPIIIRIERIPCLATILTLAFGGDCCYRLCFLLRFAFPAPSLEHI